MAAWLVAAVCAALVTGSLAGSRHLPRQRRGLVLFYAGLGAVLVPLLLRTTLATASTRLTNRVLFFVTSTALAELLAGAWLRASRTHSSAQGARHLRLPELALATVGLTALPAGALLATSWLLPPELVSPLLQRIWIVAAISAPFALLVAIRFARSSRA